MVVSGRHAVAIDEQRTTFTPTLWRNVGALNASLGFNAAAKDAPYQQKWFPGVHGSVGGGGNIRGLSDRALDWVLEGAQMMGLELDKDEGSPLYALNPDDFAPIDNMAVEASTISTVIEGLVLKRSPRTGGPIALEEVSASALVRWRADKEQLPERVHYRPKPLEGAAEAIEAETSPARLQAEHQAVAMAVENQPKAGSLYKLVYGDTLSGLASKVYGSANHASAIAQANRGIDDPDRIFAGQIIYLPPPPETLEGAIMPIDAATS